jgi:hypothetical protein
VRPELHAGCVNRGEAAFVQHAELNVSLFLFSNSEFDFSRQGVVHPKKGAITFTYLQQRFQ